MVLMGQNIVRRRDSAGRTYYHNRATGRRAKESSWVRSKASARYQKDVRAVKAALKEQIAAERPDLTGTAAGARVRDILADEGLGSIDVEVVSYDEE